MRTEVSWLPSSRVWKRQGTGKGSGNICAVGAPFCRPGATGCVCHQLTEGKMMERRKKIALELSELVVYCRPVPFDEESKGRGPSGVGLGALAGRRKREEHSVPLYGGWGSCRGGGLCQHSPCLAQRLAQNVPATGTCRPFRKPRLRNT